MFIDNKFYLFMVSLSIHLWSNISVISLLTIILTAAVNRGMHVSFQIGVVVFGRRCQVEFMGNKEALFLFLRYCHIAFRRGWAHYQWMSFSFLITFPPTLVGFSPFDNSVLTGRHWYPIGALISIFLIMWQLLFSSDAC